MVVFDTAVVDLTEELHDPVDLLFGTRLGGGTDINRALLHSRHGERMVEHTPQKRWAQPDEIAGLAVYLASDAASFVTGQSYVIDGGFLLP